MFRIPLRRPPKPKTEKDLRTITVEYDGKMIDLYIESSNPFHARLKNILLTTCPEVKILCTQV